MSNTAADLAEKRLEARKLYWQDYPIAEISRILDISYGTLDSWKRRDKWDDASPVARVEAHVEAQLARIIAKTDKSDKDFREIAELSKVMERTARIQNYVKSGKEADLNPNIENRAKRRKDKATQKNKLASDQVQAILDAFDKGLFGYQKLWLKQKRQRARNILKSRQIGATWYFAREAICDALKTGDNQIFLSASEKQAKVFRQYIVQFVLDVTGVELKGETITLTNGASLYFLGTNSKTAQSYHGHVYLDEYAWIGRFLEFRKVASAMAAHKKWRTTYFSTPSVKGHDAYKFWSGENYNRGRTKDDRVEFDINHETLKHGVVGPDGMWRHMVTIEDAAADGCDLFDIDRLHLENNDAEFANLYMCQWVDDAEAFFTFAEMQRCMVDAWDSWAEDFAPLAVRPFGERPVWIGYDPARSADNASIVVVAPPLADGGKYRILEKKNVAGVDWQSQADTIRKLTERYNVVYIGIDTSTIGSGVFEMVRQFFPTATPITYSVEVKNRMVLKAKQLISRRRVEFDRSWTDVSLAFMSIHKTATASGRQTTFQAGRSAETGHADVAWAIMHAIDHVDYANFDNAAGQRGGFVEIF